MAYVESALYVDSAQYALVAQWAATHAYTVGQIVRQLAAPTANNERCFVCIVAGTSLGTEPTWVLTKGAKTVESGGPTWQECTALPGLNSDSINTPAWAVSAGAIVLGAVIRNVARTIYLICTTAGTAGTGVEPTWNTTLGATTADGSVTWTCIKSSGNFPAWAAPAARLALFNSATWLVNAAMIIFVGDDHAESGATITINPAFSCSIICIDHTVALPAGSGNLKTTASVTNTSGTYAFMGTTGGAAGIFFYVYGIQLIQSASSPGYIANYGAYFEGKFESCSFSFQPGGNFSHSLGYIGLPGVALEFIGCTFQFNVATSSLLMGGSSVLMRNCATSGVSPGTVFQGQGGGVGAPLVCEGCDFSNVSGTLVGGASIGSNYTFKDCKINSAVTVASLGSAAGVTIDLNRCDSGGTNWRNERYTALATETTSTVVVRTGGASDGATPVSHRVATTSNLSSTNISPATTRHPVIPLAIWNAVTGSNRNVTIYGIANDSRVPNNDEVWFDVEYLGSASSPLGSIASGTKSNVLATGTALTADTSAWDSAATARANTTAYTVGQVIKTASNPGRVFACITSGTSASSEPGGYATAIDGGSVADGGAVFRAGCRFRQTLVLSGPQPQLAGYIYAYPKAARASMTYWIDPLIKLS
jgi:hypothetical protein